MCRSRPESPSTVIRATSLGKSGALSGESRIGGRSASKPMYDSLSRVILIRPQMAGPGSLCKPLRASCDCVTGVVLLGLGLNTPLFNTGYRTSANEG